jgi:murein DD-endopeptidase MepM/ murein hydrolase activator NlpD
VSGTRIPAAQRPQQSVYVPTGSKAEPDHQMEEVPMATAKADARKTANDTVVVDADAATKKGHLIDADVEVNLSAVRRPLYAYVGAADFAVEKLRELPTAYVQRVQEVQETVKQTQAKATEQAKARRAELREQLNQLPDKARAVYTDFVIRGQKLVTNLRNNPEASNAVNEAKAAVSEAKDAATHAKRAAKSGEKAAERTEAKVEVETR